MEKTIAELKEQLKKKGLPISGKKAELFQRLHGNKSNVPDKVLDKALYRKVREKVKKRVKVWPSAYASGQVVQEYKKAGGRYAGGPQKGAPLDRWYKERWVNVCNVKGRGYEPCGRSKSKIKDYPYCRPSVRVSAHTPMTVSELKKKYGKEKLVELCKKKRTSGLPKSGKAQRIRPKETQS